MLVPSVFARADQRPVGGAVVHPYRSDRPVDILPMTYDALVFRRVEFVGYERLVILSQPYGSSESGMPHPQEPPPMHIICQDFLGHSLVQSVIIVGVIWHRDDAPQLPPP